MPDNLRKPTANLSAVDETAAVILRLLESEERHMLAVDELRTLYTGELGRESLELDDALAELAACGLIRQLNPFVVMSYAARRARELQA